MVSPLSSRGVSYRRSSHRYVRRSGERAERRPEHFSVSARTVSRLSAVVNNPLRVRQVDCETNTPQDVLETDTPGGTSLTYETGANQYHYNWKTLSTYSGKCYELLLELDNGTTQIARFKFTK